MIALQHSPSSGDFRHGYVALPHCPMLWFSASHVRPTQPPLLLKPRSRDPQRSPEKEPTTKQQIGKWLVGGCGSLAIVTFGWDMWRHRQEQERHRQEQERHRQEQERVKNIILRASFRAREPPVKIERKTIKATCATFIFVVFASAFLERRDLFLR